ncbi:hypothetical protein ACFL1X_03615, partial [Candidatus Hydrogenedentota bacterium]
MRLASVFLCCMLCMGSVASAVDLPELRFDIGPKESPVARGFTKLGSDEAFSDECGYGWESSEQSAFDVVKPAEDPAWHSFGGQVIPGEIIMFNEHTPVTRDGVRSKDDIVFRAKVPNGIYRVALTLGYLEEPICSMQVYINDKLVAKDVDAKHFARRGNADQQYGYPKNLRSKVKVKNGEIRIRIHGDDSGFMQRFKDQEKEPVPGSFLTMSPPRETHLLARKKKRNDISLWGNL